MNPTPHKKALLLSYFTVGYNIIEGLVSIWAGSMAGSIALVGFGLDSFIESLSGGVMIWRFSQHGKISEDAEEKIERKAAKLVGLYIFHPGSLCPLRIFKEVISSGNSSAQPFRDNYCRSFINSNADFIFC
jgi:hypothetical protein